MSTQKKYTQKEVDFLLSSTRQAPMGVSQWKEDGKQFGYWKFFEKEVRQATIQEAIEVLEGDKDFTKHYREGNCSMMNCHYMQARLASIEKIKQLKEKV